MRQQNREGKELAELGQLVKATLSPSATTRRSTTPMMPGIQYCLMFDKPVLNHAEVRELTQNAVMHEGPSRWSRAAWLRGRRRRDDEPRYRPGRGDRRTTAHHARFHGRSVDAIRRAKRNVRNRRSHPHHFTLTDECLRSFDSNYKMNPLRGQAHVDACIAGLVDGTPT